VYFSFFKFLNSLKERWNVRLLVSLLNVFKKNKTPSYILDNANSNNP